jgi:hypothetical protein
MKKLLAILLNLMPLSIMGFAQTYEPFISETRQWKYVQEFYLAENSNQPIYFVTLGYFNEDTLINNTKYNKFYHKTISLDTTTSVAYFFSEDTLNQQVFVYDSLFHKTVLLYDFSISEGDSFKAYILNNTYLKLKVIKIDTFYTLNKELKRIMFNDSTTWIESIGNITETRIPSFGDLICVQENESLLYLNKNYNNCDTAFPQGPDVMISEKMKDINISLFPNPIERTSILEVKTNYNSKSKIEIYSNIGTLMKQDYFIDRYFIGMINFPKGLYVYRVINNNTIIATGKIIIK